MAAHEGLHPITEVARAFGLSVPALRYYEEQGLITPSARIGRVRHYDDRELKRLAYALLWHRDAAVPIGQTREIVEAPSSEHRHELIGTQLEALQDRIERLQDARATLEHQLDCPSDDPTSCPHTGARLTQIVESALASDCGPRPVTSGPAP